MYQHGAVFVPDKVVKGKVVAQAPEPNKVVGALMGFPVGIKLNSRTEARPGHSFPCALSVD